MDKILRVNMGAEGGPTFQEVPVGDYAGLGGRALHLRLGRQGGAAPLSSPGRG